MKHFECVNIGDDRSIFANRILGWLYAKYDGKLGSLEFATELSLVCDELEQYVRNIYECIDDEIPLMAYNNVMSDGADGYSEWEDYTDEEALKVIAEYCHKVYKK